MKLNCQSLTSTSIKNQLGNVLLLPNRVLETGKLLSRKVTPYIPNTCGGIAVPAAAFMAYKAISACISSEQDNKCIETCGILAVPMFACCLAIFKFVLPKFTANSSTALNNKEPETCEPDAEKADIDVKLAEIKNDVTDTVQPGIAENASDAADTELVKESPEVVSDTDQEISDTESDEEITEKVANTESKKNIVVTTGTESTEQITIIVADAASVKEVEGVVITPIEQYEASIDVKSEITAEATTKVSEVAEESPINNVVTTEESTKN